MFLGYGGERIGGSPGSPHFSLLNDFCHGLPRTATVRRTQSDGGDLYNAD